VTSPSALPTNQETNSASTHQNETKGKLCSDKTSTYVLIFTPGFSSDASLSLVSDSDVDSDLGTDNDKSIEGSPVCKRTRKAGGNAIDSSDNEDFSERGKGQ